MVIVKLLLSRHGNRCGGVIAASANNSQCGIGVAFNAKLGGKVLFQYATDRRSVFQNFLLNIYFYCLTLMYYKQVCQEETELLPRFFLQVFVYLEMMTLQIPWRL